MKYKSLYHYRAISGFKALARDLINITRNAFLLYFFRDKSKIILFYPEFPDWNADIHQALFWSKFRMISNPNQPYDYAINWEDTTYRNTDTALSILSQKQHFINLGCTDISKNKVEKVFSNIFGYSTFVDPLHYQGKIIEKCELNSKHSQARVLNAPIKQIKQGFIYQKFLQNQNDNYSIDYRVLFINNILPIVFIRYKPQDDIFDRVLNYQMAKPQDLFSEKEIANIISFCHAMKLEYGELDVIRDQNDQKIYIIDVNTTAHKPKSTCKSSFRKYKNNITRRSLSDLLKNRQVKKEPLEPMAV